jgi:hypothetical protein
VVEQPVVNQPVVEQPVVEQPVVEQPVVEQPVVESSFVDDVDGPFDPSQPFGEDAVQPAVPSHEVVDEDVHVSNGQVVDLDDDDDQDNDEPPREAPRPLKLY